MRRLGLKLVFSLTLLAAMPLLGEGNRAQAGLIIVPPHAAEPFLGSPLSASFDELDPGTLPSIGAADPFIGAADPLAEQVVNQSPFSSPREAAKLAMLGLRVPTIPGSPGVSAITAKSFRAPSIVDRSEDSPIGPASLLLTTPQTHLPDHYVRGLFRPPRGG